MDAARAAAGASGRGRRACSRPPTRRSTGWRCTASGATSSRRRRGRRGCRCTSCRCPGPAATRTTSARMGAAVAAAVADGVHPRRVRRPVPRGRAAVPRGAARRHRPDAAVSAVEDDADRGAGARDDGRRPAAHAEHAWIRAVLDASFAGRAFDAALLAELPLGVDPCGERGEFHTCVIAGPMFARPIDVRRRRDRRSATASSSPTSGWRPDR